MKIKITGIVVVAARAIHSQSDRSSERFVVANCARLASERVDSELFGAENLQSHRRVVGLFEQAHRGTLYFDEICDLPMETQGKIVRAVNEQRFRRVGGNAEVMVDVRVISASSRSCSAARVGGTVCASSRTASHQACSVASSSLASDQIVCSPVPAQSVRTSFPAT